MRHFFLSFLLILVIGFSAVAAEPEYPVKVIDGVPYYEYTVKAGDGLYSISRQFGIKQSDLFEANQGLTVDIKAGQLLYIPIPQKDDKNADVVTVSEDKVHVVEPKQTLYGISHMYGISIDSIVGLNPWATKGIRVGDSLVVARVVVERKSLAKPDMPKTNDMVAPDSKENQIETVAQQQMADTIQRSDFHVVQRKETLYAISRKYSMPIHQILDLNPGAARNLRAGDTLYFTKNPIKTEVSVTIEHEESNLQIIKETAPHDSLVADTTITLPVLPDSTLNIVYLLPFHTDQTTVHKSTLRFVEFYRGALVALQKVKADGISANVYTFDTGRTRADVETLLSKPELANADVIIGPAYSDQLEPVLNFSKKHNIPTIVPFSSKVPEKLFFPGLIQFNPSSTHFYNQVIAAFAAEPNRKYVIGRFQSVSESDKYTADELRKTLIASGVDVIDTVLNFETLRYVVNAVAEHPTTLLMASSAPADVNLMLDSLAAYQRQNIKVWGFEEWSNLTNKYSNTVYASIFNPQESEAYSNAYSSLFGSHAVLSAPRYDLLGYDLTILATKSIIRISPTSIAFQQVEQSEFLQSAPLMIMMQNRYLNNRIYVFHWDGVMLEQTDYIALPKSLATPTTNE